MDRPFDLGRRWEYGTKIWTAQLLQSFAYINANVQRRNGLILDVAGGPGPLSPIVNQPAFTYVVVDKATHPDRSAPKCLFVRGEAERLPLPDASVDIAITISGLQYFDQPRFFRECRRVIRAGGLLAVHENGPCNPIILLGRLAQRVYGVLHRRHWTYRNSIRTYYVPIDIEGFTRIRTRRTGLTTPAVFCLQLLGARRTSGLERLCARLDSFMLSAAPALEALTFLSVVHYRRDTHVGLPGSTPDLET